MFFSHVIRSAQSASRPFTTQTIHQNQFILKGTQCSSKKPSHHQSRKSPTPPQHVEQKPEVHKKNCITNTKQPDQFSCVRRQKTSHLKASGQHLHVKIRPGPMTGLPIQMHARTLSSHTPYQPGSRTVSKNKSKTKGLSQNMQIV